MGTAKDPLYRKTVKKQYEEWLSHCRNHLDRMESELPPPRVELREELTSQGVSRRDFIKWTSLTTALLMLPPIFKPLVARAAEQFSRLPVVWLHFAECTGCSEAFLRSTYPNVDDILLDTISLEYHETLMAAAGIPGGAEPGEGPRRLRREVHLRHRGRHAPRVWTAST